MIKVFHLDRHVYLL